MCGPNQTPHLTMSSANFSQPSSLPTSHDFSNSLPTHSDIAPRTPENNGLRLQRYAQNATAMLLANHGQIRTDQLTIKEDDLRSITRYDANRMGDSADPPLAGMLGVGSLPLQFPLEVPLPLLSPSWMIPTTPPKMWDR